MQSIGLKDFPQDVTPKVDVLLFALNKGLLKLGFARLVKIDYVLNEQRLIPVRQARLTHFEKRYRDIVRDMLPMSPVGKVLRGELKEGALGA